MKKLYYGGNIVTMTNEGDTVEAVLIESGKITKVGLLKELEESFANEQIEQIDLKGKTLFPGFIDAHSHISMVGPISMMANLRKCESHEEIIEALNSYIDNQPKVPELVIGFGYDHNYLKEKTHPTKEVLNMVSDSIPILILHISGHVGCCNDVTLKLAQINRDSIAPKGGTIGRVKDTNEPNGYLEETALNDLQAKIFDNANIDYIQAMMKGQELYLQNGITTAQDGATQTNTMQLLKALANENRLKLDIVAYPTVDESVSDIGLFKEYINQYHNRLKIGGYKLFLDGSPQGKTAWLSEPYEGETEYRGYPRFSDEVVERFVQTAIDDNMQLLTHCNGDAASEQLIQSYETALEKSTNKAKNELRPVMIHCQTVRDDQLDRMKDISMIPSIFVGHTYYWGDVHLKNLGVKRGNRISPAKSAFSRDLVVNFHHDAPVTEPDMLHMVWCAVNRKTRSDKSIGQDECVSVYEAFQAITINAAYAYFEEENKGTIEVGKEADFVILDGNPFTIDKMSIKDIVILETIKNGETLYSH